VSITDEIQKTVIEANQDAVFKSKLEADLRSWKNSKSELHSLERGSDGARKRLAQKAKRHQEYLDESLQYMIQNENDALHAMNLNRLLTKNFFEYENSFKVLSNIKTAAEQKRLRRLLQK